MNFFAHITRQKKHWRAVINEYGVRYVGSKERGQGSRARNWDHKPWDEPFHEGSSCADFVGSGIKICHTFGMRDGSIFGIDVRNFFVTTLIIKPSSPFARSSSMFLFLSRFDNLHC